MTERVAHTNGITFEVTNRLRVWVGPYSRTTLLPTSSICGVQFATALGSWYPGETDPGHPYIVERLQPENLKVRSLLPPPNQQSAAYDQYRWRRSVRMPVCLCEQQRELGAGRMLGAISKSKAYEPPASAPPPTGRHQVVNGVTGAQR